jgi:hypothetical protein
VQDPVHHEGLGQTFEGLCAERLTDKIAMDQLRCGLADDYCIRFSESLEPGRNIGRLAKGQLFLPPTTTHFAHHHQTSVNAEPYRQADAFVLLQAGIQRLHGVEHPQARTDRPLRVVFMRVWIAKVNQQAIPKILGDIPPKLLDHLGARGLIGAHDLSEIFRVELAGKSSRVDQVTE